MGDSGRRMTAALMVAGLLLCAAAAGAQAASPRRIVLVVASSVSAERQEAALSAIRAQLGDLSLEIVIEPEGSGGLDLRERLDLAARAAKAHEALGAFVLELDRADDLLIYLVEPEARRALVRRVTTPSSEAAGLEELSLIIRSTSGALLEGRAIGMEEGPELAPEPAKAPPPAPAPPKVDPRRDRPPPRPAPEASESTGRLSAFYVGESYAPEVGWQSGLGVGVSWSPDDRVYAGVSYLLLQPVDVDSGQATARVTRYPAELFVGYQLPGEEVRLGVELGARIELAARTTLGTAPGVEPTEDDTRLLWAAVGRAVARFAVSERVAIGAGLGAELYFNDSDYVVEVAGEHQPVLQPRTLRPRADLGVAVDLW